MIFNSPFLARRPDADRLGECFDRGDIRDVLRELENDVWTGPEPTRKSVYPSPDIPVDSISTLRITLLAEAITTARPWEFRLACACLLLERGAQPLTGDEFGTPISWALEQLPCFLDPGHPSAYMRDLIEQAGNDWRKGRPFEMPQDVAAWIRAQKEALYEEERLAQEAALQPEPREASLPSAPSPSPIATPAHEVSAPPPPPPPPPAQPTARAESPLPEYAEDEEDDMYMDTEPQAPASAPLPAQEEPQRPGSPAPGARATSPEDAVRAWVGPHISEERLAMLIREEANEEGPSTQTPATPAQVEPRAPESRLPHGVGHTTWRDAHPSSSPPPRPTNEPQRPWRRKRGLSPDAFAPPKPKPQGPKWAGPSRLPRTVGSSPPPIQRAKTVWIYYIDPAVRTDAIFQHYLQTGPDTFRDIRPSAAQYLQDLIDLESLSPGVPAGEAPPPESEKIVLKKYVQPRLVHEYGSYAARVTYRSERDAEQARRMFDGQKMFGDWAQEKRPMRWSDAAPKW